MNGKRRGISQLLFTHTNTFTVAPNEKWTHTDCTDSHIHTTCPAVPKKIKIYYTTNQQARPCFISPCRFPPPSPLISFFLLSLLELSDPNIKGNFLNDQESQSIQRKICEWCVLKGENDSVSVCLLHLTVVPTSLEWVSPTDESNISALLLALALSFSLSVSLYVYVFLFFYFHLETAIFFVFVFLF